MRVETKYIAPNDHGLPALALQVTCLVNSYMLWIGATQEEDAEKALAAGRLAGDWACAMPPSVVRLVHSSMLNHTHRTLRYWE